MAQGLLPYPQFNHKDQNCAVRWKKWHERLENIFVGYDITEQKRKKALMLTYAGEAFNNLVDGIPSVKFEVIEADTAQGIDLYTKTLKVLREHLSHKVNVEFQKYTFRKSVQTQDTVQEYYAHLSALAEEDDFYIIKS